MMEDDMKRNGSGYYDETPVKSGVFNGPQPGEIWESTMGKEFLILKNHGGYCTTLALNDNPHEKTIEVVSRTVRYTNPGMVGYSFNNQLSAYIKTVPEEKYLDIMQAVGERLGVTIKVRMAADDNLTTQADREAYDDAIKVLESEVEAWRAKAKELQAQRDEAINGADVLERKIIELEQDRNTWESITRNYEQVYKAAEEKATMAERMLNSMLDRLFARGEAK